MIYWVEIHRSPPSKWKHAYRESRYPEDSDRSVEKQKTSAGQGRRFTPWYHPACFTTPGYSWIGKTALDRCNGRFPLLASVKSSINPAIDFCSPAESAIHGNTGEFNLIRRSNDTMLGSHLSLPTRCWMVYYSCKTIILMLISLHYKAIQILS